MIYDDNDVVVGLVVYTNNHRNRLRRNHLLRSHLRRSPHHHNHLRHIHHLRSLLPSLHSGDGVPIHHPSHFQGRPEWMELKIFIIY